MSNEDQAALLSKAVQSLEWAKNYLLEACEGLDPTVVQVNNIIRQVKEDIAFLESE